MLKRYRVTPDRLLLDPNNPRLARNFQSSERVPLSRTKETQPQIERLFFKNFGQTRASSQDGTDQLLGDRENIVDREFFSIKELKDSMKQIGFVGIQNIIVREIPKTDSFVVLEGNRRVASIKAVLAEHEQALPGTQKRIEDEEILESLREIEVMVLLTDGLSEAEIQSDINRVLGLRHYGSRLNWELLPRAKNIYDEYVKLVPPPFRFDAKYANRVAKIIAKAPSEVRKLLKGYVCYEQLASHYPVAPSHFSLILAGVENSNLTGEGKKFFDIDNVSYKLTDASMDAMNKVCEFEDRDQIGFQKIIRDPKQFRKLGSIKKDAIHHAEGAVKDYASGLFEAVCEKEHTLDDAHSDLRAFKKRLMWVQSLQKLLDKQASNQALTQEKFVGGGEALRLRDEIVLLLRRFRAIMDTE